MTICFFEAETDAFDLSIGAILPQQGRPVAFMSRTLNSTEKNYQTTEKEATAIMDTVRKWSYSLMENFLLSSTIKNLFDVR